MERLWDLFRQLGNSLDLAETLATLDSELRRLIRYDTISVHLVEDGRLVPAYAAGAGFQALASLELAVGDGLLGGVAATRRPVLNTVLAAGIEWNGRITAVLALYRHEPGPFAEEDLKLVTALAPKLAAALNNARRFGRAEKACSRALFERLDAEVARARRTAGRLAVLECAVTALDPDRAAVGRIADELRHLCREYDFVAHSGGTLVVVLPDFAPEGLAEKRARIEAVFCRHGLTATIGAAFLPDDGADAEDLLTAARRAASCQHVSANVSAY